MRGSRPDARGSLPLKRTSFTDRHDGRVPGSFAGARAVEFDDGPKGLSSRYLPRGRESVAKLVARNAETVGASLNVLVAVGEGGPLKREGPPWGQEL